MGGMFGTLLRLRDVLSLGYLGRYKVCVLPFVLSKTSLGVWILFLFSFLIYSIRHSKMFLFEGVVEGMSWSMNRYSHFFSSPLSALLQET